MNHLWSRLCSLLALCLAFSLASAQSLPDVLKAFRKLQADTEAGVNYKEYLRGMAEVNAQMKTFADSSQGKPAPRAMSSLQAAFQEYEHAKGAWLDQQIDAQRYDNGEMSIKAYFDRKRELTAQISKHWESAGQEIDRAATLMNQRGGSKGSKASK